MSIAPEQTDARARRGSERPPGGTDLFSSERSFSPPIGVRWAAEQGPCGYFIDFGVKTERAHWPPDWLQPFERQIHVATVQWGLGAFERYAGGDGEEWLAAALQAGEYLRAHQHPDGPQRGGWRQHVAMPHTYRLDPPWLSAITQGEGASLFARLHRESGEDHFAEGALEALRPMSVSSAAGGTLAHLGGLPFVEEYPTDPPSYVLNGAIFALWGYYDVGRLLGDGEATRDFETLGTALARNLWRYDTGYWSRYDLYPHLLPNVASPAYHLLHINQLRVTDQLLPGLGFAQTAERFESYRGARSKRARAVGTKIAFRLANPRNSRFALRVPWARQEAALRRESEGNGTASPADVLVLAYHAVSSDWDAPLATSPDQLREQVGMLIDKGYRGTTFAEALSADAPGAKLLAVTFDDGYRSVASLAAPVLAELGVPATVFVPTAFIGSGEPMSWPGIDQWLDGPYRQELCPMSWEEAATLVEGGWEIGSHTRSHPRLTEIPEGLLEEELTESRREIEQRLGSPCPSLAYPYGDHDERVVRAAAAAGYEFAAAMPARIPGARELAWPRAGIYRGDTMPLFRLKVSPLARRLRRSAAGTAAAPILRALRSESGPSQS